MHRISCCTLSFNYLNHHLFRKHPSADRPTGERITSTSQGYGIAGESSGSGSVRRRGLDEIGGGIFQHRKRTPFFPPRGNWSLSAWFHTSTENVRPEFLMDDLRTIPRLRPKLNPPRTGLRGIATSGVTPLEIPTLPSTAPSRVPFDPVRENWGSPPPRILAILIWHSFPTFARLLWFAVPSPICHQPLGALISIFVKESP